MTNMLLSRLSHFTRSAAAGAFAVLYPAPAAEAGADAVISDPVALPPDNISASSPTSSPNQDIVKGLIRNQVAGLLNILLATKETLDPDLQKLIPVLQDANIALKRRPAPAQQQRPRGTRGGGRQKKSASRATRITSLRAAPTMGSQAAAPKTLPPSRPSPAPTSLDATAPPWPRGQSPPQQAPSQEQHCRRIWGGRRKVVSSRPRPISSSSQESPNEGSNVCLRTTYTTSNDLPPPLPLRAPPSLLNANAPPWPRGQPVPVPPSPVSSRHRS